MDVSRVVPHGILVSGRRKREQVEHAPCADFEPACLRRRELPVGAEALATHGSLYTGVNFTALLFLGRRSLWYPV